VAKRFLLNRAENYSREGLASSGNADREQSLAATRAACGQAVEAGQDRSANSSVPGQVRRLAGGWAGSAEERLCRPTDGTTQVSSTSHGCANHGAARARSLHNGSPAARRRRARRDKVGETPWSLPAWRRRADTIHDVTRNFGEARAISGFLHDGERTRQMRRGHHRGRRTGRRGHGRLGKGVSFFYTDRDGFYLSHRTWGKQEEMEAAVEDDG
jgi:hypothetical protein